MKEFVDFLLKQFVNNPEAVNITETMDGNFKILNVKVADEDMGLVIGKEGKTINSLRNLVRAKAIKDNVMVRVILEDNRQPTADSGSEDAQN